MNEETNLHEGLEMAIECIRDLSPCYEGDEWDDSEEAAAISGIRAAQHYVADLAQLVAELEVERNNTAAHVASIARQLGDESLQVDDIAVRVLGLVAERDEWRSRAEIAEQHCSVLLDADEPRTEQLRSARRERDALRARLAEIEAQEPVGWQQRTLFDGQWSDWQDCNWRTANILRQRGDYEVRGVYARPVPARAVPDGWRLVPKRLTKEMRAEFVRAAREYMQEYGGNSPEVMYEAAVDAVPEAAR